MATVTVTLFVRFTVVDPNDHLYRRTRDEFFDKLADALARSGGTPRFYRARNDPPGADYAQHDITLLIEFSATKEDSATAEDAAATTANEFMADPDLREIAGQAQEKGLVGGVSTWLTVNHVPEGWPSIEGEVDVAEGEQAAAGSAPA